MVYHLSALGLETIDHYTAAYSVTEFCTAVKPRFLRFLFDTHRVPRLIYFDPDIMVFDSINDLTAALARANIALTPHFTHPSETGGVQAEIQYLRLGTYNLGFIGLRDSEDTRRFLDWWDERAMSHGYDDSEHGVFTDQQWVNLVPGLFRGVRILDHPGMNVAYSNLGGRKVSLEEDRFFVNGKPLVFFHFHKFQRHMAPREYFRGHLDEATARALFDIYAHALDKARLCIPASGNGRVRDHALLSNGGRYPPAFRRACRRMEQETGRRLETCGSLDELGTAMARSRLAAPYLRSLAYHEWCQGRLGSAERTLERYRASSSFRFKLDLWFYCLAPRSLRFPAGWVETSGAIRVLRRIVGAIVRAISWR
jgi:hypothetical protein